MSGDADTGTSSFTCDSSTIEILSSSSVYSSAPFFYVTNTEANIDIKDCTLKFGSGQFLLADEGDWGTSGSNGGTVTMTLTNQAIEGDIVVGSSSSLTLTLVNSTIKGTINSAQTASKLDITLDADSTITLTGDSYYTSLTNDDSENSNIVVGSYTWTTYDESSISSSGSGSGSSSSESGSSNSSSSSSSSSGTPPEKPGSDQGEPDQSGTPPEKPGSDQEEQSSNATRTNTISTTISTTNVSATTNQIVSTNNTPVDATTETSVVLLGFSDYEVESSFFSFFIYFSAIESTITSTSLTFPIDVQYNTALRNLETKNSVCTLQNSNLNGKLQYKCEVQTETANIKQITIEPNFNFEGQNVNLAGTTPVADQYMDNIEKANELNYLKDTTVNILDNSKYRKGNSNTFTISGVMSDPQPSFGKTDLILQLKEGDEEVNATCTITDIQGKNYILSCSSDEEINQSNLESGYSKVGDNIILVIFAPQNNDSTDSTTTTEGRTVAYKHSSDGLSGGAIAGIVIGAVAVAAIFAAIAIFVNKGSKPPVPNPNVDNTTQVNINPGITN